MTKKIKKFLFTVNFPVDGLKNLQDYEIDWLFSLAEQYEIDKLELARAIAELVLKRVLIKLLTLVEKK